jgi:hypothetical protein
MVTNFEPSTTPDNSISSRGSIFIIGRRFVGRAAFAVCFNVGGCAEVEGYYHADNASEIGE